MIQNQGGDEPRVVLCEDVDAREDAIFVPARERLHDGLDRGQIQVVSPVHRQLPEGEGASKQIDIRLPEQQRAAQPREGQETERRAEHARRVEAERDEPEDPRSDRGLHPAAEHRVEDGLDPIAHLPRQRQEQELPRDAMEAVPQRPVRTSGGQRSAEAHAEPRGAAEDREEEWQYQQRSGDAQTAHESACQEELHDEGERVDGSVERGEERPQLVLREGRRGGGFEQIVGHEHRRGADGREPSDPRDIPIFAQRPEVFHPAEQGATAPRRGGRERLRGSPRDDERRCDEEPGGRQQEATHRHEAQPDRRGARAEGCAQHAARADGAKQPLALGDREHLRREHPELEHEHRADDPAREVEHEHRDLRRRAQIEQHHDVGRDEARHHQGGPPPEAAGEGTAPSPHEQRQHGQERVDEGQPVRRELGEKERVPGGLEQGVRGDEEREDRRGK